MLGYGASPAPTGSYGIPDEVSHLTDLLDRRGIGTFHLVAHSLGAMIGLHLRRALDARVTRMTLIEPVVVSVLRETGEDTAYREMEGQYQGFMDLVPDPETAARFFVGHWSGSAAWSAMGAHGRAVVTSLVPKLRQEMIAARSDCTALAWLAEAPPPTTIVIGEKTLLAPRATACRLGSALAARIVEVPGAAHMIPLTHPQTVVDTVLGRRLAATKISPPTAGRSTSPAT